MEQKLKLVIVDDHQLVLQGLSLLIRDIPDCELLEKFASPGDLLKWLKTSKVHPDICLTDIEMSKLDGPELVRILKSEYPCIRVAALTMHEEPYFINRMIVAGADGYLHKNIGRDTFEEALSRIMVGNFFVEGIDTSRKAISEERRNDGVPLTDREIEIVKLIALGRTNKEIARKLFISHRTVDTHRTNIKKKLKVSSLAGVIQYAHQEGYL